MHYVPGGLKPSRRHYKHGYFTSYVLHDIFINPWLFQLYRLTFWTRHSDIPREDIDADSLVDQDGVIEEMEVMKDGTVNIKEDSEVNDEVKVVSPGEYQEVDLKDDDHDEGEMKNAEFEK